jgi:TonB-dependent starch-binding outer membrane protein SusC
MGVARRFGMMAAFAVAVSASAGAQVTTGTVTGRVVDSTSSEPLAGVTVRVTGTQLGTQTSANGSYTIGGIPSGAQTLQVNRIGYAAQRQQVNITLGGTITLQFFMRAVAATLSDVVVTGYGTQTAASVTGSISTIRAEEANVGVAPDVNNLIQGRAAGVQVTTNSGEPGGGVQIRVRNGTSLSGGNEPLYVIDGVPIQNESSQVGQPGLVGSSALARSPLNMLNPSDIADITILKDASATAIYGSRGANGVVLIQTKKGKAGVSNVNYDGYVGMATTAHKLDILSPSEFRNFIKAQVALRAADPTGTAGLAPSTLANLGSASTNFQDEILRTATIQNQNVSFSGGSEATQYRGSVNYFDQPGTVINSGFRRYQGRLNGTSRAFGDRLTSNLNLTASQTNDRFGLAENTGGFEGGVFTNVLQFNPTLPVTVRDSATGKTRFYEIGPGSQGVRNPVAILNQVLDRAVTNRILGNVQSSYAFIPSLTGSVNVGVDNSTGTRSTYVPTTSPIAFNSKGFAQQAQRNLSAATVQTLLTFDRGFDTEMMGIGKQSLNVVGGYEYQRYRIQNFGATSVGFTNDANEANNLQGGKPTDPPFSDLAFRKLTSLFARANYGLKDRYFLTGVVRRDGSSVFGANNKYAVFPAVSASWRLSEEPFLKGNGYLSDLKLRAGFGTQGNQAISPYQTLPTLGSNSSYRYPFGNSVTTGILPNNNPNPDLKWEETKQVDVGLDFGLLNSSLTGSLEYYSKVTSDLLFNVPVPPAVASNQYRNIGRLRAAGAEATLDYNVLNRPGTTLTFGVVASSDRNHVIDLGGQNNIQTGGISGRGASGTQSERIVVGGALPSFYAPQYVGVVNGIEQFKKYDATGKEVGLTTTPGTGDYRESGNPVPKFTGGFRGNLTTHGFDASFLVRGQSGFKVFNNTAFVYATKSSARQNQNFLRSALNDGLSVNSPAIYSTRFIEDGSFIRLQNVTLGYAFKARIVGTQVSTARIYVSGDNLLLGSKYSGPDPEVFVSSGLASRGIDYLTYPRARTFLAGLSLGL